MCACVYVSLSECFIFTPPRIFWRARLSFESFEVVAKQNKTRQKIFANTHSHTCTTNVFQKYCLIWKVLRRSSVHEFHICVLQHTNTQSQGQSTWGRVFWACQWLSLLTQFVCLPLSPLLYRSRSGLRCRSLFFLKRGWGRCITRISRTLCGFSFFILSVSFILTMLVALLLLINCQIVFCILYSHWKITETLRTLSTVTKLPKY